VTLGLSREGCRRWVFSGEGRELPSSLVRVVVVVVVGVGVEDVATGRDSDATLVVGW
jgi:hypothetical protein